MLTVGILLSSPLSGIPGLPTVMAVFVLLAVHDGILAHFASTFTPLTAWLVAGTLL